MDECAYSTLAYGLALDAAHGSAPEALARAALTAIGDKLGCNNAVAYFAEGHLSYCVSAQGDTPADGPLALLELLRTLYPSENGGNPLWRRPQLRSDLGDGGPPTVLRSLMAALGWELAIALSCGGRPAGVLALGDKPGAYTARDFDFLEIVAAQLSLASANAAMKEDLDRSRAIITRSDRLSSIGAMTAGLAHEIRNPLVSLRTFTQLLPEKYDDEEFRSTFLDLTLSEIDRVCTLVGELLTYARPAADGEEQSVDVADCIERMCLLLSSQAKSRSVRLDCAPGDGALWVRADEDRLKQVVMNVAMNALQAGGKRVEVACSSTSSGEVVRIDIRDDGPGMDEATRRRVFEPFFTTRREGTGLGLPIARQIVEEIGGRIEIDTAPGQGTCFAIILPSADSKTAGSGDPAVAAGDCEPVGAALHA